MGRRKAVRAVFATLTCVGLALAVPDWSAGSSPSSGKALAQAASTMPKPLLGGWTADLTWYNAKIGPVQIYRMYDLGFSYATWQDTLAYQLHGNAQEDYSFNLPPADVAAGLDDAQLTTFIASTRRTSS
jgi:hypothetical protein